LGFNLPKIKSFKHLAAIVFAVSLAAFRKMGPVVPSDQPLQKHRFWSPFFERQKGR
jgi:hypothetical protein